MRNNPLDETNIKISLTEFERELQEFNKIRKQYETNTLKRKFWAQSLENSFLLDAKRKKLLAQGATGSSCSYEAGPDIYKLLYTRSPVRMQIPDSLVYFPSERISVYMFTDSRGVVNCKRGAEGVEEFFCKGDQLKTAPRYIHLVMNGKVDICYSSTEARKVYEQCPYYEHKLQIFIPPATSHVSKVRVSVKSRVVSKIYTLTAKNPIFAPKETYQKS